MYYIMLKRYSKNRVIFFEPNLSVLLAEKMFTKKLFFFPINYCNIRTHEEKMGERKKKWDKKSKNNKEKKVKYKKYKKD